MMDVDGARAALKAILGDERSSRADSFVVTADGYLGLQRAVHDRVAPEHRRQNPRETWTALPWCVRELMLWQVEYGYRTVSLAGVMTVSGDDAVITVQSRWRRSVDPS